MTQEPVKLNHINFLESTVDSQEFRDALFTGEYADDEIWFKLNYGCELECTLGSFGVFLKIESTKTKRGNILTFIDEDGSEKVITINLLTKEKLIKAIKDNKISFDTKC